MGRGRGPGWLWWGLLYWCGGPGLWGVGWRHVGHERCVFLCQEVWSSNVFVRFVLWWIFLEQERWSCHFLCRCRCWCSAGGALWLGLYLYGCHRWGILGRGKVGCPVLFQEVLHLQWGAFGRRRWCRAGTCVVRDVVRRPCRGRCHAPCGCSEAARRVVDAESFVG